MADTKISALTAGAPALATDQIPVARSGINRKLLVSDIVSAGIVDITYANLITALGGTLVPGTIYHTTTAPDGSTALDEIWVLAITATQLADEAVCLVNTGTITNRIASCKINFAAAAGSRLTGYSDSLGNNFNCADRANLDKFINILTSSNVGIIVNGGTLTGTPSGALGDNTHIYGDLLIDNTSYFDGFIGAQSQIQIGPINDTTMIKGDFEIGSSVIVNNGVYAGIHVGYIIFGVTIDALSGVNQFNTDGNARVVRAAPDAGGDTVTVDVNTGTLIIIDGSTDVSINMPDGLFDGQKMTIVFMNGSGTVTWGGNVETIFFVGTFPPPSKLEATWDATMTRWT